MHYLFLMAAIVAEVIATSALKSSKSFTVLWPSVIVVIGYGTAFYCLSLSLEKISMGAAYGIWSAVGMVLLTVVGFLVYKQTPDFWAIAGMGLVVAGVLVMGFLSKSVSNNAAHAHPPEASLAAPATRVSE